MCERVRTVPDQRSDWPRRWTSSCGGKRALLATQRAGEDAVQVGDHEWLVALDVCDLRQLELVLDAELVTDFLVHLGGRTISVALEPSQSRYAIVGMLRCLPTGEVA